MKKDEPLILWKIIGYVLLLDYNNYDILYNNNNKLT